MTTAVKPFASGATTLNINHPRELIQARPAAPTQPLASWADEAAQFTAFIALGATGYAGARNLLMANHMYAVFSDVAGGSQAAFKLWVKQNCSQTVHGAYFVDANFWS